MNLENNALGPREHFKDRHIFSLKIGSKTWPKKELGNQRWWACLGDCAAPSAIPRDPRENTLPFTPNGRHFSHPGQLHRRSPMRILIWLKFKSAARRDFYKDLSGRLRFSHDYSFFFFSLHLFAPFINGWELNRVTATATLNDAWGCVQVSLAPRQSINVMTYLNVLSVRACARGAESFSPPACVNVGLSAKTFPRLFFLHLQLCIQIPACCTLVRLRHVFIWSFLFAFLLFPFWTVCSRQRLGQICRRLEMYVYKRKQDRQKETKDCVKKKADKVLLYIEMKIHFKYN